MNKQNKGGMMNDLATIETQSAEIKQSAVALVARATKFQITNQEGWEKSSEILGNIAKAKKDAETMRKSFTAPLNQSLKAINDFFKGFTNQFDSATGILKGKVRVYYEQEQEKKREANKQRLLAEAKADEERKKREEKEAKERKLAEEENRDPIIPEPTIAETPVEIPKVVAPDKTTAGMTIKKIWKFKITYLNEVPREYFIIDESRIRQAIRDGKREIEGVCIYEESNVAVKG